MKNNLLTERLFYNGTNITDTHIHATGYESGKYREAVCDTFAQLTNWIDKSEKLLLRIHGFKNTDTIKEVCEHYGIDVTKAKQALIRFHNGHIAGEANPILAKYTADFDGTFMANWSTSAIIDCYMEMVNAGHIEDTASTEVGA